MDAGGLGNGNVTKYSPGVLVGNWQEEGRLREERLQLYQTRKAQAGSRGESLKRSAAASVTAAEWQGEQDAMLSQRLTEHADLSSTSDSVFLHYGTPVMVLGTKTGAALSIDLSVAGSPAPGQAAVTGSRATEPQVRSCWVLQPCRDENNAAYRGAVDQHDAVHYGQRVRIASEAAGDAGLYYVQSSLSSGLYSSQAQAVVAAMGPCADNVFVVARSGGRRDATGCVGERVRLGEPVVLLHSLTNRPLSCPGALARATSYGAEYAVTCDYVSTDYFSRVRSGVAVRAENLFAFTLGGAAGGALSVKPRVATALAETMPLTCGSGVEDALSMLREAALTAGGCAGLRAFACALGVPSSEHRRTMLTRAQLKTLVQAKLAVDLSPQMLDAVMRRFDQSGNNVVCAQELMTELRGNMTPERVEAVANAYNQLLIEGEGCVEFKNMLNLFRSNAAAHPDVVDGLVAREQLISDFEKSWPSFFGTKVGQVTRDEFMEYYTDLSPAIPDDTRFSSVLRSCWAIPLHDDYLNGKPSRAVVVTHPNDTTETVRLPDTLVLDINDSKAVERILVQHGVRDIKSFTVVSE